MIYIVLISPANAAINLEKFAPAKLGLNWPQDESVDYAIAGVVSDGSH